MTQSETAYAELRAQCQKYLDGPLARAQEWARSFASPRKDSQRPVSKAWEHRLLQLRERIEHLIHACELPPAAALYGQTGCGKTTLACRWLGEIKDQPGTAVALPDSLRELTFLDLNPDKASEATAVVTRFTGARAAIARGLKGKFEMIPLSDTDFLLVLAAAFDLECQSKQRWDWAGLQDFVAKAAPAAGAAPEWKDVSAAKLTEVIRVLAEEFELERFSQLQGKTEEIAGLLGAHEDHLPALASYILWEDWPVFVRLWSDAAPLLTSLKGAPPEVNLAVLPFILDSSCTSELMGKKAKLAGGDKLVWSSVAQELPPALRGSLDMRVIQSIVSEAVLGIERERLPEFARPAALIGDLLDIPGLVATAGGGGTKLKNEDVEAGDRSDFFKAVRRGKELVLFAKYSREHILQHVCFLLGFGQRQQTPGGAKRSLRIFAKSLARPGSDTSVSQIDVEGLGHSPLTVALTFSGRMVKQLKKGDPGDLKLMLQPQGTIESNVGAWWKGRTGPKQVHLLRYHHLIEDERVADAQEATRRFLDEKLVVDHVSDPARIWSAVLDDADGGVATLFGDLKTRLSRERREAFLRGRFDQIRRETSALLNELHVDAAPEREAAKRREFAQAVGRDLLKHERPALVLSALRSTLEVPEALAVRGRAQASSSKSTRRKDILDRDTERHDQGLRWLHETLRIYVDQLAAAADRTPLVSEGCLAAERVRDLIRWLVEAAERTSARAMNVFYQEFSRLRNDDPSTFGEIGAAWASLSLWGRYAKLSPHRPADRARKAIPDLPRGPQGPARKALEDWTAQLPELLAAGVGEVVQSPAGNDELGTIISVA